MMAAKADILAQKPPADSFPVWVRWTDSRRSSQDEDAAPLRHAGDRPTSHEAAGAPEKRCPHDGHQRGDVGITRQIQDESVKVETLHSYISGQRQSYHHDSQRFE